MDGDALDELVDFAHGRAVADHVVVQIDFRPQAQIFAAKPLDLAGAFHGHGGDTGDGRDQLKIVVGETHHRIRSVEINQSHGFIKIEQRDADLRMHRRGARSFAGIVAEDADTLLKNLLCEIAVHVDGVLRAGNTIPSDDRREFRGVAAGKNSAALGGNNVEDHTQELPLQRFNVTDRTDGRRDFQQRL